MRAFVVALTAFGLLTAWVVQAQPRQGSSRPAPPPPTPPPTQTVPPPIVYPFAPLMTPPAGGLTPRENPPFRTPARPNRGRSGGSYFGPYLGYPETTPTTQGAGQPQERATGWLRLAVTPTNAQVFVDGYYVGTVDDVNAKRDLALDAGPHRIRFIALAYQTLAVDVQIAPGETVTYRGALEPATPAPSPAPRPAGAQTSMYLIPNCYLGNVPPRANRLPAGCDIKHVQVLPSK
jgi:hypothetical protein